MNNKRNNDACAGAGAGAGASSSLAPTNILQLLQKETELHEKTRKGHQHERKKLQAKLAMLVKAKSKKREKTVIKEKCDRLVIEQPRDART